MTGNQVVPSSWQELPQDGPINVADDRKENAELRRANEILKTASAFFAAAELDRKFS